MVRIYFDWNIYSYIRTERGQVYSEINDFLSKNKSSILLAYSPAHLQDLNRSYFKSEKGKLETEKDLDFLGDLTSNHCLCYDFKEKSVYPNVIHPKEYFQEIFVDTEDENLFNFENLFDNDDPLGKLWQSYWKLLKLLPSGIDFTQLDKLPKEYQIINDFFKSTKGRNTFGGLLEDILNVIQNLDDFEKIFKTIRANSNKDLKIETDNSKWGNPFDYMDNVLKRNKLQKSFFELTTETIKNSNKKASRFDYFSNYYIQLDIFGYHKDKKLSNLIDDAAHSFYAAHTDIFVTDDDNTNRKSSALYKQLNIDTEVVYSTGFLNCMRERKLFNEERPLLEQVQYLIENSLLLMDSVDDELNPARVFMIKPLILDYFNRMQISEYGNSTSLIFYKKQGNYSNFLFWTEMETVVNRIVKEFGTDDNNREIFQEIEKKEVLDNNWKGRFWSFRNFDIGMNYIEEPFGLAFKIEIKRTVNKDYDLLNG
ncbi:hypothetical protein [Haliscomenobacter sp.]|uniref:hypothetical protein n=1 Tax=Haliscomenobacter sp. TaxID=2717303 RepID=UPI003BAC472B